MNDPGGPSPNPQYTWPWFLLAAFLLGLVLAVLWMGVEVRRTRERREFLSPTGQVGTLETEVKTGQSNVAPAQPARSN